MKTNFVSCQKQVLFAIGLTVSFALPSTTLLAQTFAGQPSLRESPASLRVLIIPVSNESAVRINVENQGRGIVHIQISDSKGKVFYDEIVAQHLYTSRFELAALPAGLYTIELQTIDARYTELIRIEAPTPGRVVAVANQPEPPQKLVAQH